MRALLLLLTYLQLPQRPPQPSCAGGQPMRSRPASRIVIFIIVVVAVVAMLAAGFEPGIAIALAAACGVVAAEVAVRLLGSPPAAPSLP